MQKVKILFAAANDRVSPLALDEEAREIEERLAKTPARESVTLVQRHALRPNDLIQSLLQHGPQIVHFSGHGSRTGDLTMLDAAGNARPVLASGVTALFAAFQTIGIRLVVLNACFAAKLAESIRPNVDCVIGMDREISDGAAIEFAATLYQVIGFGQSVRSAHEVASAALGMTFADEQHTPRLIERSPGAADLRILGGEAATPESGAQRIRVSLTDSDIFNESVPTVFRDKLRRAK